MKTYFDDPVKQEMLNDLLSIYNDSMDDKCDDCVADNNDFSCGCPRSISILAIEKATGDKIEEVIK